MKKVLSMSGLLFFLIFTIPCIVIAAPVIDQSQTSHNGSIAFWSDSHIAQTFIPQVEGYLDYIVLGLGYTGVEVFAHIEIVNWNNSSPGSVLGQVDTLVSIAGPSSALTQIDFSTQNIALEAGNLYGIVLSNDLIPGLSTSQLGTDVQWDDNLYADGALWSNRFGSWNYWPYGDPNTDMRFETYMDPVPIPGALWLLGSGLVGLIGIRRKMSK